MKTTKGSHNGFTIIEMLVVIGIITLLVAMLLPALSGVQNRSRKNTELSHLRQVGLAWMMYAQNNNDAALPGYLDEDVQERWRIRVEFPYDPEDLDDADGPGAGLGDVSSRGAVNSAANFTSQLTPGDAIPINDDQTGATWTWRLLPYLDFSYETVLGYHDASDRTTRALVEDRQRAARHPAFGYNGLYIGGRWEMRDGRPQYFFTNATAAESDGSSGGGRLGVVSRTVSHIHRSSEVVVFCSSARITNVGVVRQITDVQPGFHTVTPPIVADELQWGRSTGASPGADPGGSGGDPRLLQTFVDSALIPIGRYNRQIPTLYADGSVTTHQAGGLADQRKWINIARTRDFEHLPGEGDTDPNVFP